MSDTPVAPRWRVLVTPRWLGWHLFAVVAFAGMWWLGDWQLRRALAGNSLSWAYTFEWPIFAIFGAVFWVKTVRDELHPATPAPAEQIVLPAGAGSPEQAGGSRAGRGRGTQAMAGGVVQAGRLTRDRDDDDEAGGTNDVELAEYNAYLAMLNKQVKDHGKWHGLR